MLTPEQESKIRVAVTKYSPMDFAAIYFRKHITLPGYDEPNFAECHYEWAELAKDWVVYDGTDTWANAWRHAFLAPRATGKSSWWLLILPMWAAAHGHAKFVGMFADTYTQALQHATTFRRELETNPLLRRDFPELCAPGKSPSGMQESNRSDQMVRGNGFVLLAKGMDSGSLGMKVGANRPDLLILDDIEPDEANYSEALMKKRRGTLLDAILALNIGARVVISGTVTMPGSITHQLIKWGKGIKDEHNEWVGLEGINVHHALPILEDPETGELRSQWPHRWALEDLLLRRHTREYKKNMENNPRAVDSDYWSDADFTYGTFETDRTILSIDGAVTATKTSDYTGLAVVSVARARDGHPRRCLVEDVRQVKWKAERMKDGIQTILDSFPHISEIHVEVNQGGDMWANLLKDLGVRIITHRATVAKEKRAQNLLKQYQLIPTRVYHARPFSECEDQMIGFPTGSKHDDMIDAVGAAVTALMRERQSAGFAKPVTYAPYNQR